MPRPRPSHAHIAKQLLDTVANDPASDEAAMQLQFALINALLAIADETAALREHVHSIAEALKTYDGVDVGTSLGHIHEALKDIADRR